MPPVTPYSKYLGDRDPIAALRETSARVATLTSGWSPADFERTYEPGKWSARLILAHLAHIEIASGMRVRMARMAVAGRRGRGYRLVFLQHPGAS